MFRNTMIVLLLLLANGITAQTTATAIATVSASIINPVGTESSTNTLSVKFEPSKSAGIIMLNNNGMQLYDGKNKVKLSDSFEVPEFGIIGEQSTYSITLTYQPQIKNTKSGNETIQIASMELIKDNLQLKDALKEKYSIAAKLRVNAAQEAGQYTATTPCVVIVHFN